MSRNVRRLDTLAMIFAPQVVMNTRRPGWFRATSHRDKLRALSSEFIQLRLFGFGWPINTKRTDQIGILSHELIGN